MSVYAIKCVFFLFVLQEGATKDDIERLPKYLFRRIDDFEKQSGEIQGSFGGIMTECDTDSPIEHALPLDDAVCPPILFILSVLLLFQSRATRYLLSYHGISPLKHSFMCLYSSCCWSPLTSIYLSIYLGVIEICLLYSTLN